MAILEVKNLNYAYQDGNSKREILTDLSCEFERGKFYTILGKSGSGKTSFLSLISALDEADSGHIYYENEEIHSIGFDNYRRNKIGIIFQAYNLIPYMTALENVQVAMSITENTVAENTAEKAYQLLEEIGITRDLANQSVTKLSGGEQQRVAIARALSTNVDLILADEPTGNLDTEKEKEIVEIFKNLAHQHDKCVIAVTHSQEIAKESDQPFELINKKLIPINL